MIVEGKHHRTVWLEGSIVKMIDQPRLPHEFRIAEFVNHHESAAD